MALFQFVRRQLSCTKIGFGARVALVIGGLIACGDGTAPDKAIDLRIDPDRVDMIAGTSVPVSVSVVNADGSVIAVMPQLALFISSNVNVVQPAPDSAGFIRATGMGVAQITITVSVDGGRKLTKRLPVIVGQVTPPAP